MCCAAIWHTNKYIKDVGRLGSGSHLVGRIGSGVRISASFQIFALRMLLHTAGGVTWSSLRGNLPGVNVFREVISYMLQQLCPSVCPSIRLSVTFGVCTCSTMWPIVWLSA